MCSGGGKSGVSPGDLPILAMNPKVWLRRDGITKTGSAVDSINGLYATAGHVFLPLGNKAQVSTDGPLAVIAPAPSGECRYKSQKPTSWWTWTQRSHTIVWVSNSGDASSDVGFLGEGTNPDPQWHHGMYHTVGTPYYLGGFAYIGGTGQEPRAPRPSTGATGYPNMMTVDATLPQATRAVMYPGANTPVAGPTTLPTVVAPNGMSMLIFGTPAPQYNRRAWSECIMWDRVISAAERAALSAYLNSRYAPYYQAVSW